MQGPPLAFSAPINDPGQLVTLPHHIRWRAGLGIPNDIGDPVSDGTVTENSMASHQVLTDADAALPSTSSALIVSKVTGLMRCASKPASLANALSRIEP